jgi:hypothetical protein
MEIVQSELSTIPQVVYQVSFGTLYFLLISLSRMREG